ncbi:MAG: T9SS type A sorting domain-containing protein [Fidelibacterota bacterium]
MDVYTQPSNTADIMVRRVPNVGVGAVNPGVYLVEQTHDTCSHRAYVGPAMSYWEQITDDFDRLIDERWFDMVDAGELLPLSRLGQHLCCVHRTGSRYSQGRELEGKVVMGVEDQNGSLPVSFTLYANYPNPFNPARTISYELPARSRVIITIYDILGREIRTLVDNLQDPGQKSVIWDGTNDPGEQVSAGVYLYQIQAGDFTQTRKMVLLK